jgi:5-methyltetrahydrofolate--homocysteine methyltransferase
MMAGLKTCSGRFESGEYFLPELMGAGEALTVGMKILAPELAPGYRTLKGIIVLGTVREDVHDTGKNLVGMMLESAGFVVVNLGVDVSAETFAQALRDHKPQVVGMESVIEELEHQEPCHGAHAIIGRAPTSKQYAAQTGADGYGNDAAQAVKLVRSLL